MIIEIGKKEFERKFPEISTYGIDWTQKFLENGVILLDSEWNGESYYSRDSKGITRCYRPVYEEKNDDGFEVIGYEEMV